MFLSFAELLVKTVTMKIACVLMIITAYYDSYDKMFFIKLISKSSVKTYKKNPNIKLQMNIQTLNRY